MAYEDTDKDKLIEALQKTLGVVTTACLKVGIARETYYQWLNNDPEFASKVESLKDVAIDFVESSLFKQIESGVPSSTMFYLKTKAKHRGYIERNENYNLNLSIDGLSEEELLKRKTQLDSLRTRIRD